MRPLAMIERAAGSTTYVIKHPISSAAYAAGLARGLGAAVLHTVAERGPDRATTHAPRAPERLTPVPAADLAGPPAAEPIEPQAPHESFATEPKATSRESAHGGHGHDAEIDEWAAEALDEPEDDVEDEVEAPVDDTEPLLDPAIAKAVRSEAEIMRKAADPHRG